MARRKISKKEDVERRFIISDEQDTRRWGDLLQKYYEENDIPVDHEWFSKDKDTEIRRLPGLYSVDNLFTGNMDAISALQKTETSITLPAPMKKERDLSAFTLSYEGRGSFRYDTP